MGFGRHLVRYVATGAIVVFGIKLVDSLGYTPMIRSGFDKAVSGITMLIKDTTGKNVNINDAVDIDSLIATAENVKNNLPETEGINVSGSIDDLISLSQNLKLNEIPSEYAPQIQEILNTSTNALEDMNVNLDDVSFDSAFNLLTESINKLRNIENEIEVIHYDVGEYDNYGTYHFD